MVHSFPASLRNNAELRWAQRAAGSIIVMKTRINTREAKIHVPLAARMRPRRLEDFVGHDSVLGKGTALRRAIEQGTVGSLILWGPPGVGKTTLAEIIAHRMHAKSDPVRDPVQAGPAVPPNVGSISNGSERISAVTAGVRDLKRIIDQATERRKFGKPTVLIVDEIHRFNKAQQDVLLPSVEEGLITLIGATTENPYFEVIKALVSRAEVVRFEKLEDVDVRRIVRTASGEVETLSKGAEDILVQLAGGDARRALNVLERASHSVARPALSAGAKKRKITAGDIQSAAQQTVVQYDKAGDAHYDTISAFIKSIRGSDPDAALFYLFRMIEAGEDPKFIIRRMYIFASEDIGNADPHALMLVNAAAGALEWVGLPEAEFALAHCATYLSAAPKSSSVTKAMSAAKQDVRLHGNAQPPGHITNAPIEGMKQHGRGVGYKYPHDYPAHVVEQQYRPDEIQDHVYYKPGTEGFERQIKARIERARALLHGKKARGMYSTRRSAG